MEKCGKYFLETLMGRNTLIDNIFNLMISARESMGFSYDIWKFYRKTINNLVILGQKCCYDPILIRVLKCRQMMTQTVQITMTWNKCKLCRFSKYSRVSFCAVLLLFGVHISSQISVLHRCLRIIPHLVRCISDFTHKTQKYWKCGSMRVESTTLSHRDSGCSWVSFYKYLQHTRDKDVPFSSH